MIIDSPIISGSLASTGSLNQIGNVVITGSLTVTGPIAGSITGSADSASFATTASYAVSASHAERVDDATSASYAVSASHAERVDDAISSSYAVTSSYSLSGSYSFGATSASYAASSTSASYALNSTTAVSSSYPLAVTGSTIYSTFTPSINFSTTNSVYIGNKAGDGTGNSYEAVFIGKNAGSESINGNNYQGIFIGTNAGVGGRSNQSVMIGAYSGVGNSGGGVNSNVYLGTYTGYNATNVYYSSFIGPYAGQEATNAYYSNFIGSLAGYKAKEAYFSTFFGGNAGYQAVSASYSVILGYDAGYAFTTASSIGDHNIIIGHNLTLPVGYSGGINIGGLIFGSGSYKSIASPYYQSSGSANGKIGINQPTPLYNLDVSGSGNFTNGLTVTGSLLATSITSSLLGTASYASQALSSSYAANADLLDGRDSLTYANTGSNTFTNTQYINAANNAVSFTSTASLYTDGGVRVTKDMYVSGTAYFNNVTVFGTQSISYISSSQLNIGTNIISVNTDTPTIRFGGLAVYDSGSTGLTGSMLWDSQDNQWIYSNPSGSEYDSAMFLVGPRNSGTLGNEVGITCNFLSKGNGMHHMTSSGIFEDGSRTCFYGNTVIGSGGTVCSTMGNFTCVGVGSPAPAYPLDICGTARSTTNFVVNNGTVVGNFAIETAQVQIGTSLNHPFVIYTCNNERIRVTNTGIACFSCQVCAPAFVGGTISGTTIYGSTIVCSPQSNFTYTGNTGNVVRINGDNLTTGTALSIVLNNGAPTHTGNIVEICNAFNAGATAKLMCLYQGDDGDGIYVNMARGGVGLTVDGVGSGYSAIFNNGNVGIGTTTPYANLHVLGTIKVATGNAQGILGLGEANGTTVNVGLWRGAANAPTSDGNYLNLGGYDGIVLATGNAAIGSQTERVRLDTSGNLMVGSLSAGNAGTINVSVGCAGTTAGGLQLWAASNQTHYIQFGDGTTGGQPYAGYVSYAHGTDSLAFGTATATRAIISSTGIACFSNTVCAPMILASGCVGVNITDPLTRLHVQFAGTTTTTCMACLKDGALVLYNANAGSSTNGTVGIFGQNAGALGLSSGIGFSRESSGNWGTQLRFYTHPTVTTEIDVICERMRITGDGNVGIGCNTPTNSRLLVAGTHISGNSILGVVPVSNNVATIGLYNSSGTRTALFYSDTGFVTVETDTDPLLLRTAGTNRLSLSSTGIACFACTVCAPTLVVSNQTNISPDASGTGQLMVQGNGYQGYTALDATAMYIGHNSAIRNLTLQTDETSRFTITGTGIACFACQVCAPTLIGTTVCLSTSICASYGFFPGISIGGNPVSAGTGATAMRFTNSGGDLYLGQESCTAGGFYPGSKAYDNVFYTACPFNFIFGGASKFYISAAGVGCFAGNVCAPAFIYGTSGTQREQFLMESRTLCLTAGATVEVGCINFDDGAGLIEANIIGHVSGESMSAKYILPAQYGGTSGAWTQALPITGLNCYNPGGFALDYYGSNNIAQLRLRRTTASPSNGVYTIGLRILGNNFTYISCTCTATGVTAPSSIYAPTNLTINGTTGNVGIGIACPSQLLEIKGSAPLLSIYNMSGDGGIRFRNDAGTVMWNLVHNNTDGNLYFKEAVSSINALTLYYSTGVAKFACQVCTPNLVVNGSTACVNINRTDGTPAVLQLGNTSNAYQIQYTCTGGQRLAFINGAPSEYASFFGTGIACFSGTVCTPSFVNAGLATTSCLLINSNTFFNSDVRLQICGKSAYDGVVRFINCCNQGDVNHGILHLVNSLPYALGNDASLAFSTMGTDAYPHPRASIGVKTTGNQSGALVFNTRESTWEERLRISDNGIACFKCQVCAPAFIGGTVSGTTGTFTSQLCVAYSNAIATISGDTGYGILRIYGNSSAVELQISAHQASGFATVGTYSNSPLAFKINNTLKVQIDTSGNMLPTSNGTQDLGSSTCRWCTVYTSDLSLNNGIGNYTIVEGENDLFLYNNNSCKVYKFVVQEVCPEIAPAKRSI